MMREMAPGDHDAAIQRAAEAKRRYDQGVRFTLLPIRCTEIADQVVPEYRDGKRSYACHGHTAKRWQAAWDGACIALGGDPAEYRR